MRRAEADLGAYVRVGVADTSEYLNAQLGGSCLATQNERWTAPPDALTAPIASGHGTFVAGLIHQNAPAVELVAEQVLGQNDDDPNTVCWPAASPAVLSVTAHDADGVIPDWGAPADLPWVEWRGARRRRRQHHLPAAAPRRERAARRRRSVPPRRVGRVSVNGSTG
jgi:hypothetical protein